MLKYIHVKDCYLRNLDIPKLKVFFVRFFSYELKQMKIWSISDIFCVTFQLLHSLIAVFNQVFFFFQKKLTRTFLYLPINHFMRKKNKTIVFVFLSWIFFFVHNFGVHQVMLPFHSCIMGWKCIVAWYSLTLCAKYLTLPEYQCSMGFQNTGGV